MLKSFIIALFALLVASCKKQEPIVVYSVEKGLDIYVESFFTEAAKRGVGLSKENLIVTFTDQSTSEFCGECFKPSKTKPGQRTVKINLTSDCWETEPVQNKEALVFHELGHCLLNREHLDVFFSNGIQKTIMTTVLGGPYQPCIYAIDGQDNTEMCNFTSRRDYYLDELFGLNPASPAWAK